jgi:8-oxo-dGTP pyrophosphatase MutT (NUDIX family)
MTVPRKASTVVLLREKPGTGLEVFLLKRSGKSSFMAGNFVYPGGQLEEEDRDPRFSSCSRGITAREACTTLSLNSDPEHALGYYIAALRELFEEAGILPAYDEKGDLFIASSKNMRQRFAHYRASLQSGKMNMQEMLVKEGLKLALDRLHYFAHWITPEPRDIRFDTRFFLALLPPGQKAEPDREETTRGLWIAPIKALQENIRGTIAPSPPTLKTLEHLAHLQTLNEVLDSLAGRPIEPILPVFTEVEARDMILLPSDPDFARAQCRGFKADMRSTRLAHFPDPATRFVLTGGRWLPYSKMSGTS